MYDHFDDSAKAKSKQQQHVSMSIPKDESMTAFVLTESSAMRMGRRRGGSSSLAAVGASGASKRSRSVDFRFFEELKENYFPGAAEPPPDRVFGQSLYKCILNDLRRSTATTTTKRRSNRDHAHLIASKHDLTVLNSITNVDNDLLSRLIDSTAVDANPATIVPTFNNKRNSVLFEALDLKRMSKAEHATPPNQNLVVRSEGLVPNIVKSCCRHISEFGLDVVGIFRIDSSKKRIKEVRAGFIPSSFVPPELIDTVSKAQRNVRHGS